MSTTQPEALRENHTAADMATAAAQGFRDGVASVAAGAGSEPVAWQYRSVRNKGMWFDCTEERAKQRAAHPETWEVRYLYTHPSPPEGAEWRQGVEAAAALLSKKADDFAQEHGYDDMGSLSFGRGAHADAKLEYHSTLLELAEEIRSLAAPTPPAQAADSVLEDAARYRWLAAHCRSTSEHWGGRWSIVVDGPAPELENGEYLIDEAIDKARKQGANHD